MSKSENFAVDVVISWVNGKDENHRSKVLQYLEDKKSINRKALRSRFDQVNEIEFAVKSILKYAKFVRYIYIVTDNQTPGFLKDLEKAKKEYPTVFMVDHKVIFKGHEHYLPTFNSRSIETQLSKIPGLAEHFIYLNDDFFLIKETKVEDFFKNGHPLLRGKWKKFNEDIFVKQIKYFFQSKNKDVKIGHKAAQEKAAKLVSFKKYFKFHHTPQPLRKSTIENFFSENKGIRRENIKHRFRSNNQFLLQSLANHLEIKNKTFLPRDEYQLVYFPNYKKPFWWIKYKLKNSEQSTNKLFLCMQSLDLCSDDKLNYIKNWLEKKYN
jgi:hypothetical protein